MSTSISVTGCETGYSEDTVEGVEVWRLGVRGGRAVGGAVEGGLVDVVWVAGSAVVGGASRAVAGRPREEGHARRAAR
jgi:hypothetical protein